MLKSDQSFTCLGKKRVKKSARILAALGDLDELIVSLGLVITSTRKKSLQKEVIGYQKELMEIGGFLAGVGKKKLSWLKKKQAFKKRIISLRDHRRKHFSLPGKNSTSTFLHLARTIARRLERKVVGLNSQKYQPLVNYLNQFSLLLFWLAVKEEK